MSEHAVIDPVNPDPALLDRAARLLHDGELVVLPTETVYGVAADVRAPGARSRLFAAKGRPAGKPFARLAVDIDQVEKDGAEVGEFARSLADAFWPGPLTLVLPTEWAPRGYRAPDHAVPQGVGRRLGPQVALTSANRSGQPPACTADEAVAGLDIKPALVLDAGPSSGTPSTVVSLAHGYPELLREGTIPFDRIEAACTGARRRVILFVCTGNTCRSPMAEHLFRERLGDRAEWSAQSAGISAAEDMPATQNAVHVLREKGIDMSGHLSRRLTTALVRDSDLIVTMTAAQREEVCRLAPECASRVKLLTSFHVNGGGEDVHDPIGGDEEAYRQVRDRIDSALSDLILYLLDYV
ncbi:Sua5/YciO/YrdC/YwlC family protein [Kiritimatiella glycovorans]|uniref:L-threonylcarbamoyladenylate synthase n=1 Tax=Kiritimatiella glycovorans TaxID=1307763 RepID=A0A0G3EFG4_9BACT|nr:Sua5/YciO/YrdC/YwlC family protein [Kiritimatiella glycovorans]AKJ65088.1 Low molecular weight protein-tyrosine-phosphatase YwlE [Kiritimatiella glycovorans]